MFRHIIVGVVVAFGLQIALTLLLVIVYDLTAIAQGWTTISEAVLDMGRDQTAFAVLVTVELCAPVFLLLGHLLFGQAVKEHAVRVERQRCAQIASQLQSSGIDLLWDPTEDHEEAGRRIAEAICDPPRGWPHSRADPPGCGPL